MLLKQFLNHFSFGVEVIMLLEEPTAIRLYLTWSATVLRNVEYGNINVNSRTSSIVLSNVSHYLFHLPFSPITVLVSHLDTHMIYPP